MSVCCGVECVVVLGCLRWGWKRCTYIGGDDSATWSQATMEEFDQVPHICRAILAIYEEDLRNPQFPPMGGYRLNPDYVVKRVTYEQTSGRAPPYLIYLDHDRRQIVLAIRGLNLVRESDYKLLLDNRLGMQMFDGGYVHHGLLKSAVWLLNQESDTLKKLWVENGKSYDMVFAGHSLGSGVAALLTVIVVNHREMLGGIPRDKIRCYSIAPARVMSLNLAVKYADVIHSLILQDDFLPRTPTPLEDIFKSIFWPYCFGQLALFTVSHLLEGHIHSRRCGRFPPEVRTAIPVDGRFEHIVLSCHATSDHAIIWIQREAEKAVELMKERNAETITTPPKAQRFERLQTIEKEHKDALERAVSLNIPHAVTPEEEEPLTNEPEESCSRNNEEDFSIENTKGELSSEKRDPESSGKESGGTSNPKHTSTEGETNWNDLVERLFERTKSGRLQRKNDIPGPE